METVQLPPQAGQTVARAHGIFGPRLIGASLYGSATLCGLRPDSDLDILFTLDGKIGEGERRDPRLWAMLTIFCLVLSLTAGESFKARDTVAVETLASRATSSMVILLYTAFPSFRHILGV